jgi:hypothetical protein
VTIEVPRAPEWLGRCHCSFCLRTGSLIAYYPDGGPENEGPENVGPENGGVRITGETMAYIWGDRMISQHHCPICGCFTDWRSTGESYGKVGINARLLDGYEEREERSLFEGREIEVRFLDDARG